MDIYNVSERKLHCVLSQKCDIIKLTHNGETLVFNRTKNRAIPWEGQLMTILSPALKSYIAGFLDGDGCIMMQLVRRKDYLYGYQIRASVVFYQKTVNRHHLKWLKEKLNYGYIRDRNDDMTEYTIVGIKPVVEIVKVLKPYVRLKKKHIEQALKIDMILKDPLTVKKLIDAAYHVDVFKALNYSKKRKNTSKELIEYLRHHKLYPRND